MSLEKEIRAIIGDIEHHKGTGKLGKSPEEAHLHREIEGIWDALLLIGRELDARAR